MLKVGKTIKIMKDSTSKRGLTQVKAISTFLRINKQEISRYYTKEIHAENWSSLF